MTPLRPTILSRPVRAPQPLRAWHILLALVIGGLIVAAIGYLRWGRLLEQAQRRVQMEERQP